MFVGDEFLVSGAVLHADFFAFQGINAGKFTLLADEQRGILIVRGGEQHLLFTLRSDVHPGHDRVETTELQAGDQAIEGLVGKGAGRINLFTQGVRQIDVKADNFVIGIDRFKWRVGGLGGETNGLGCGSGEAHARKKSGNQYFFHRHFPENINVKDSF